MRKRTARTHNIQPHSEINCSAGFAEDTKVNIICLVLGAPFCGRFDVRLYSASTCLFDRNPDEISYERFAFYISSDCNLGHRKSDLIELCFCWYSALVQT